MDEYLFAEGQFRIYVSSFDESPPSAVNSAIYKILSTKNYHSEAYIPFIENKFMATDYFFWQDKKRLSIKEKILLFFNFENEENVQKEYALKQIHLTRDGVPLQISTYLKQKINKQTNKKYYLLRIISESFGFFKIRSRNKINFSHEELERIFDENKKMVEFIGNSLNGELVEEIVPINKKKSFVFIDRLNKMLGKEFEMEIIDLNLVYGKSGDCTAFMLRKILEKTIILVFLKNNLESKIKKADGSFYGLKKILSIAESERISGKIILNSKTKKVLDNIKFLGDNSAHNILAHIHPDQIDNNIDKYLIALEELSSNLN